MPISVGTRVGACAADAIGDVYVRPFPEGEPAQRISTDGGFEPLWSRDGRKFCYRAPAGSERERSRWMVVDVATEPAFTRSRPRPLFEGPYIDFGFVRQYDITPDGRRLVTVQRHDIETQPATTIELVLNWFTELKERVPPQP